MTPHARIAFVCEGDAESPDKAFSGCAKMAVDNLRALGSTVRTLDAELYGIHRAMTAARTFSTDRAAWRAQFRFGALGFDARTARAHAGFRALAGAVDVVLQCGATFEPPGRGTHPYAVFCDWNMARTIHEQSSPFSPAKHIPVALAREIDAREARIYAGASAIFTFSDKLRESFIQDYGIAPARVFTTHPGPNFGPSALPEREDARPAERPPTVLFIGRDFARKGGDVLLAAFALVREVLPDAVLRIVGPAASDAPEPGVEMLGSLRKTVPAEAARLTEALRTADVFCFPTRYEPFGIVLLEAMAMGKPCVASDTFAVPEMVLDGETGYTVPAGDAAALASRLLEVLRDPPLARRLGEAGHCRVREHFSWANVASIMQAQLDRVVHGEARRR
jgi:glycosyltransferase involved in cell wall biosynthesis